MLNHREALRLRHSGIRPRMYIGLSLKDAAMQYSELGWRVFPLRPNSKLPQIKKWPTKATSDRRQVDNWWTKWPDANVAIVTGEKSGLFVVDIDPKNDGANSLTTLLNTYGDFPDTANQKTGSGGDHFLFKVPDEPIKTRRGFPDKGIDICGDGGYIVAAPSIHPNGNRYEWVTDPAELKESPQWLIDMLISTTDAPVRMAGTFPEGQRNDQLFRAGCSLRSKGTSKRELGAELHSINAYQCAPPLSDTEVNQIIDSVNRYVNQEKKPLFRFRDYVRSEEFPKDPTLRHILHAVSFYMDVDGKPAFPTEVQLAEDTGYARKTVIDKLKLAEEGGHILRKRHRSPGQPYSNYIYLLPKRFMTTACNPEADNVPSKLH